MSSRAPRWVQWLLPACAGLWAISLLAQPTKLPTLEPLPEVDSSAMDAAIARGLAAARLSVEEQLRLPSPEVARLAPSYGELGRRAFSYSLTELARVALANASALEPEAYRWHYLLGALFQQQRRLDEAVPHLEAALAAKAEELPALLRLAQVEQLRGRAEVARHLFERVLALEASASPYQAAAHLGLGQLARGAGQLDAAARELEQAYARAPEAAEVAQQLGLTYRELGRLDEARRFLTSPAKSRLSFPDPEVEALQAAYPFGLLFQGIQARAAGRLEEAATAFRSAVEADPGNAILRGALASTLLELEQPAEAVPHLEAALRSDPENLEARLRLSRAYLLQSRWAEASHELEMILAKSSDHVEALAALGSTLVDGASRKRAEWALRRLLEVGRKPTDLALAHYRLARLELARGETAEARRHFQESVVLSPTHRPAVMGLADLLAASGEPAAAIGVLDQALETATDAKDRSLYLFNAAVLEQQGGALDQALARYGEAAAAAPESFDPHFYRGALLGRMGRFAEAATSLARAVELAPDHPQAPLALASALAASGQQAAAAASLERALARARARQAPAADLTRLEQALARVRETPSPPP